MKQRGDRMIHFRSLVRSILPGSLASIRVDPAGLEFEGLREFEPGEDSTLIDWAASQFAYPRETLVRLGTMERNVMVSVLWDASRSMETKRELLELLSIAIAEEITQEEHQLGWFSVTEEVVEILRPNIRVSSERAVNALRTQKFTGRSTSLASGFEYLLRKYGSFSQVAVVISDMRFPVDYVDAMRKFFAQGNQAAFLILRSHEEESLFLPWGATLGVYDVETKKAEYILCAEKLEDMLKPHIEILELHSVGWAVIGPDANGDLGLDQKMRSAFSSSQPRKEVAS